MNEAFSVKAIGILVCMVGVFVPAVASATHNTPNKAKKFQADLVTSYEECTSPNTSDEDGIPGCQPPTRSNPVCGFGPKGKGKVIIKVVGNKNALASANAKDIQVQAKLSGLDSGCEGLVLSLRLIFRMTGDGCLSPSPGTSCTIVNFPLEVFLPEPVFVENGKWRIKTTMNDQWPTYVGFGQFFVTLDDNEFDLVDVYVVDAGSGMRTFEPGLTLR